MLKNFTGFKGKMAAAEIGNIQFVILAPSQTQLAVLWESILPKAGPLDFAGVKSAILISPSDLPEASAPKAAKPEYVHPDHQIPTQL